MLLVFNDTELYVILNYISMPQLNVTEAEKIPELILYNKHNDEIFVSLFVYLAVYFMTRSFHPGF